MTHRTLFLSRQTSRKVQQKRSSSGLYDLCPVVARNTRSIELQVVGPSSSTKCPCAVKVLSRTAVSVISQTVIREDLLNVTALMRSRGQWSEGREISVECVRKCEMLSLPDAFFNVITLQLAVQLMTQTSSFSMDNAPAARQ